MKMKSNSQLFVLIVATVIAVPVSLIAAGPGCNWGCQTVAAKSTVCEDATTLYSCNVQIAIEDFWDDIPANNLLSGDPTQVTITERTNCTSCTCVHCLSQNNYPCFGAATDGTQQKPYLEDVDTQCAGS